MIPLNLSVYFFITFFAVVGIIASLAEEKNANVILITSNLAFIFYGLFMIFFKPK